MKKRTLAAFGVVFSSASILCFAYSLKKLSLEEISDASDVVFIGRVVSLAEDGQKKFAKFDYSHILKGGNESLRFVYRGSSVSEADAILCCDLGGVYLVFGVQGLDGYYYGANGPYSTYRVE